MKVNQVSQNLSLLAWSLPLSSCVVCMQTCECGYKDVERETSYMYIRGSNPLEFIFISLMCCMHAHVFVCEGEGGTNYQKIESNQASRCAAAI